jgi:hypothetical protein
MAMTGFERELLAALKMQTGNRKLKEKDMLEWRTGKIEPRDGEQLVHLKHLGVWVCIPASAKPK